MSYKNSSDKKEKFMARMMEKITKRGHKFIFGTYETKMSTLSIYCKNHDLFHKTSFPND